MDLDLDLEGEGMDPHEYEALLDRRFDEEMGM